MFRIDRRLIQNFDWFSFSTVIALSVIGVMTIFSATRQPVEAAQAPFFIKQAIWFVIGLFGLMAFISFDYIWLSRISVPVYVTGLVLLMIVLISGKTGMGAQRWISLGPLAFQPSEFFKLIFIIMLSQYLSFQHGPLDITQLFRVFFMIVFLPFILLFKQPDLGTAIVIFIIFFSMLLVRGLQKKALILIMVVGVVSLPF